MAPSSVARALVALVSVLAGITLALNHPLWPAGMLAMLWCVVVLETAVPGAWLLLVPASLPFLNFSPWTGWIAFEELDIVLLAALAGGYGRWACLGPGGGRAPDARWSHTQVLWCALALTGACALVRGVTDAGGWSFDWFAGYSQALNSVRVFKSLGFALLLWPLLHLHLREIPMLIERRFARGMVLGLVCVCCAVLWERAGSVGVWNFSSNYRTVALFWEMHVGGAAIDGYLSMAAPFAVWALAGAKRPASWFAAALLVLLAAYACLTTFSRGVYLAVLMPLLLLGYLLHRPAHRAKAVRVRWRLVGAATLIVMLGLEVLAVLGGDSFMSARIANSEQDMGSRVRHWRHGLELLHGSNDWWLGKGLGRLPANYASQVEGEGFSGEIQLQSEGAVGSGFNRFVTLRTPPNLADIPGVYALTQRVELAGNGKHRLSLSVRVREPVELTALLCQRHLLYDRVCQWSSVRVESLQGGWQRLELPLLGPPLVAASPAPSRLFMLAISMDTPGGAVDIDNVQLTAGGLGQELLANGDFSRQLAQWLPAAQSYFTPWHIDNLYLELLIERGWLGGLVLGMLIAWALVPVVWMRGPVSPVFPYLATSLFGALVVGLVSSILDVPRVALVFYLLPILLIGCKNRTIESI